MHLINKSRTITGCFILAPDLRRKVIVSAIEDRHKKLEDFFHIFVNFNLFYFTGLNFKEKELQKGKFKMGLKTKIKKKHLASYRN